MTRNSTRCALLLLVAVFPVGKIVAAGNAAPEDPTVSEERSEIDYWNGLKSFQKALRESGPAAVRRGLQEALGHFQKGAEELRPYPLSLHYLGLTYAKLGRPREAMAHLRRAIEMLEEAPVQRLGLAEAHRDLGATLYQTENYAQALKHFERSLALQPSGDPLAWLYEGLCHYHLKEGPPARASLSEAARRDPALAQRAAYTIALTFLQEQNRAAALHAFRQAAADGGDPRLRDLANQSVQNLEKRPKERPHGEKNWAVRLSIGGQYDSNVILQAENGPTLGRITNQSDAGLSLGAGGDLDLWTTERGRLSLHYDFFGTIQKEIGDFDLQAHLPRLRAVWRGSRLLLGIEVGAPFYRLGDSDYLRTRSIEASLKVRIRPWTYTQASYGVFVLDYRAAGLDPERDGVAQEMAFRQYFHLRRPDRFLFGGYRRRWNRPESTAGNDFRYSRNQIEAGFQTPIHAGSSLRFRYAFRDDTYPFPNSQDPFRRLRDDHSNEFRAVFRQPLRRHANLDFGYVGVLHNSSLPDFRYRRQIGSVSLQFEF